MAPSTRDQISRAAMMVGAVVLCALLKPYAARFLRESFSSVMDHPGACFSCEQSLPDRLKYLGQRSKCVSCENDMIARGLAGEDAHAIRYYENIPHSGNGIANLGRT